MNKLTAIILTRNEAAHIQACVESVAFADAVVVFDSGSSDATVQLAETAGARVLHHPFENYAAQRNAALDAVRGETRWVLFVDADERVTLALASEIHETLKTADAVGYRIPRHNYIFGRVTLGAGWFPDYQTRLLDVNRAHYDPEKIVHEVVLLDGPLGTLEQPLVHYNYRDMAQFADKQRRYSTYEAEILFAQGQRAKPWSLLTMPVRHFLWRYVTLGGWRLGWHGFLLSVLMGCYEFRKYRLLGEMARR